MTNQPIPIDQAEKMIELYINYIKDHGIGDQTQSVAFNNKELVPWFDEVKQYADQFRIFMGLYPPDHEFAGRLSVIIWPYKNGKPALWPLADGKNGDPDPGLPIKPFNDGTGTP